MKNIKYFIEDHQKGCKIALIIGIVFLVYILLRICVPSFGVGKYGDRLQNINNYKISSSVISDIKNQIKDNASVDSVTYKQEGRIINFMINVDNMSKDESEALATIVTDGLSKKIKNYYDIQVFITSTGDTNYSIIGYKSKTEKSLVWSNN